MIGFRFPVSAFLVVGAFTVSAGVIWLAYGDTGEMIAGEPPLIKASARPLKVDPDDPGGQTVADLGGVGDLLSDEPSVSEERLLPRPEQPLTPAEAAIAELEQATAPPDGRTPNPEERTKARAALEALVSEITAEPLPSREVGTGGPVGETADTLPSPARPAERVALGAGVDGARSGAADTQSDRQSQGSGPPSPNIDQPTGTDIAAIDRDQGAAVNPLFRATAGGRFRVQLAAVRGEEDAKRAWTLFREQLGPYISGLEPFFERAETSNGIFYRVQVGPFGGAGDADSLCIELKKQNASCFVVSR